MEFTKLLYKKGLIKNLKMVTQSQIPDYKFEARLNSLKMLHGILKAFDFAQEAVFNLKEDGIHITVEDSQCIEAIAHIGRECFIEYHRLANAPDEDFQFCLNLSIMTQILVQFTTEDSSMKMMYKGPGAPFILLIEKHTDEDLITESAIKTRTMHETLNYSLDAADRENHVVLQGGDFLELFNDLEDGAGQSSQVEIHISPQQPNFRITTSQGNEQSELAIEMSKNSEIFSLFESKSTVTEKYKFNSLRTALKPLPMSTSIMFCNNVSGMLNIQMKIDIDEAPNVYIDYYLPAEVNDDFD
jgi:cell cycle checkpoint protein